MIHLDTLNPLADFLIDLQVLPPSPLTLSFELAMPQLYPGVLVHCSLEDHLDFDEAKKVRGKIPEQIIYLELSQHLRRTEAFSCLEISVLVLLSIWENKSS